MTDQNPEPARADTAGERVVNWRMIVQACLAHTSTGIRLTNQDLQELLHIYTKPAPPPASGANSPGISDGSEPPAGGASEFIADRVKRFHRMAIEGEWWTASVGTFERLAWDAGVAVSALETDVTAIRARFRPKED